MIPRSHFTPVYQPLPPHVEAHIGPVPKPGAGVHSWLFSAALKLHRYYESEVIFQVLKNETKSCDRIVPDREIRDAVKNSAPSKSFTYSNHSQSGGIPEAAPRWPEIDPALVRSIIESTPRAQDRLSSASQHNSFGDDPSQFVPNVVGQLFPGNPLICAGEENYSMRCNRLSEWGSQLASMQFIVPSSMTAESGFNQSGELSFRCLDNTGPRRHLIVEFDDASPDEQAAFHIHLSQRFLLVAVVHSGGKSLHGWYYVKGRSESEIAAFMQYAVRLGADPHTLVRCQPVRMPGGMRRGGFQSIHQKVLFLNPELPKP
ncbi:MAG: hypothetical protein P1U58_20420 [Verrucomicrobiales bacterium]|nr:hypothetical protein [Verrucomicrobiales bacterium]